MKTLNKRSAAALAAALCLMLLLGGCAAANSGEAQQGQPEDSQTALGNQNQPVTAASAADIGLAAAKQAALDHAGLGESQVTFVKEKQQTRQGVLVYEIDFVCDGAEYEYRVAAADGAILKFEQDSYGKPAESGDYIGLEAAKQAALAHAGVAQADATFFKAELDYEDGVVVYEIEFIADSAEYEYDIRASDGSVYAYSREAYYGASADSGTAISLDAAKQIALDHAGLAASQVAFSKAKLDYDDGRAEYEIEFYCGGLEYEYEIDAVSGAILSADIDS